jgi:hypothetical protein
MVCWTGTPGTLTTDSRSGVESVTGWRSSYDRPAYRESAKGAAVNSPDFSKMGKPPTEPVAELRSMANMMWQMYVALTAEGFNERQALAVIGATIAAGMANIPDEE